MWFNSLVLDLIIILIQQLRIISHDFRKDPVQKRFVYIKCTNN